MANYNLSKLQYKGNTYTITASYANYAGYKSSWDGLFNAQGNFLNAGAAIAANQFVFFGKDNKVYPVANTTAEIDPAWPIVYCTATVASGAAVTWSYLRSWGYFTPAASIGKDTLVADDTVYMRCTYTNGKLYSTNTMTQNLVPGNTYIKLGKMYSATAVSVNTYNSEYFTLDTDGHIKALNGYLFNAAKADTATTANTASTVSKASSTAAGTYGILFDSNPITSIIPTTTVPSVNAGLTFNPSTGNLSSTLFTGSGAGLTEVEKTANKVTSVGSTSTDDQYPSAKAVYDAIPSKVDYSNTPFTGTCSTAIGTMAKTVTVDSSFQLVDGVRVRVYMEKANTNSTPTLNVNGTGAKSIGIQGPYGALSNAALSAWYSGAFNRNGWFDFVYAASYDGGKGRWIIEDSPATIRLANFVASSANRVTTINSTNGTLVNGGVRYTVVANGATGNPFSGSAAVLWLNHDNTATYTRQIAMSANTPPHMAFRSQDSGGETNWQPWEYVLTAANQYDSHMATLAYTAAGIDFTTGAVTIPINGTQYKLIQLTLFNNDITKALGYPSLFLFNASGTTGYKEGTSYYCSATSTSSNISVTFDSSFGLIGSTSIDITALYRRIS